MSQTIQTPKYWIYTVSVVVDLIQPRKSKGKGVSPPATHTKVHVIKSGGIRRAREGDKSRLWTMAENEGISVASGGGGLLTGTAKSKVVTKR